MLVGLARVSTSDQSLALQLDALRAAGCERIFYEHASAEADRRPEFEAALEFMRAGDTLVVWRLDRLARSLKKLIACAEDLEARQIGLRSLTEQLDTNSAGGRLVFHLFGSLAEFERALLRERTAAGLAAARNRGRVGGRPKKIDDKALSAAKALLADPTFTVAEVAARLGVSPATLYRALPAARSAVTPTRATSTAGARTALD